MQTCCAVNALEHAWPTALAPAFVRLAMDGEAMQFAFMRGLAIVPGRKLAAYAQSVFTVPHLGQAGVPLSIGTYRPRGLPLASLLVCRASKSLALSGPLSDKPLQQVWLSPVVQMT